jgi:fatty-acyl-CoA synthase
MFHVHAWGIPFMATFLGVKQVYPGKYVPAKLLDMITDEGVTFSHCVPTVLSLLLRDQSSARHDLSKLKCVIGGQNLSQALCLEALDRGIDVFAGYGMSETCPIIAIQQLSAKELSLTKREQARLRCRTGRSVGLTQLRLRTAEGADAKIDDRSAGEIQVRGPSLTQGYYKDSAATERLWAGGWLHTQDVSVRDPSGSLRITDRLKDVIKVGGEWLSSLEIEDALAHHPAVAEVGVVGKADLKWGEIPLAVVALKPGQAVTERELQDLLREYVSKGSIPREAILTRISFAQALPKTSVGKTNKLALRESLAS